AGRPVLVQGVVDHRDHAKQTSAPVVLQPDASFSVQHRDVVAHGHGASAQHDSRAGTRTDYRVPLDHAPAEKIPRAIDHDARSFRVHDHVVTDDGGRIQLDLDSVSDLRIGSHDILNGIALHEQSGHHAAQAVMTTKVHGGGRRVADDVPADRQTGYTVMVGHDRDPSDSRELRVLDGDIGAAVDPDRVDA